MQFDFALTAGQPTRINLAARYVCVLSTGLAASVTLALRRGNTVLESITSAARGTRLKIDDTQGPFDAIELLSATSCTVQLVASDGQVDIDTVQGATVNVTALTALPVSNDRGSPGTPVYVSGITYSDAPATSIADNAAVAVTAVLTAIMAANTNRKAARFTNLDAANDVAIGGAGLTWAKRCIVLGPGDTWVEERAANLAWSAICNAGQTASVTVQEVLA